MIFNSVIYENSMPDGMGTLEIIDSATGKKRLFIPLKQTQLTGVITGPLAQFQLSQIFGFKKATFHHAIEAIYRFPLPGDAVITGVQVSFGEEVLKTTLKERDDAKDEYHKAFEQGRKGILVTRETPDIFTLHLTGIEPDNRVTVNISLLQYAIIDDWEMVFRIPLTVSPRYIRDDEMRLPQRHAHPQIQLLDPGHTFTLDLIVNGNPVIKSPSHQIITEKKEDSVRITLQETEAIPDRDFILTCIAPQDQNLPQFICQVEEHPEENSAYLLTTFSSPKKEDNEPVKRELIILVDHSWSMRGPKWQASDWTVKNLLKTLQSDEYFNLGIFHDSCSWLSKSPILGTEQSIYSAINFLTQNQDSGGTNLGIALEQALLSPKIKGSFVRHIVIITDAEVTDEGRLIRMVRSEQCQKDMRSVSVICIDASPNTPLVRELARVGKGIARFLTSNPSEQDITTALQSALNAWKQPYVRNPTFIVNRNLVESGDQAYKNGSISLNSLPYGMYAEVFRVPLIGDDISIARYDADGNKRESGVIIPVKGAGIRELFGSSRIRTLEQIQGGFYTEDELQIVLKSLGYEKEQTSLYPEGNTISELFLDDLLVQESLRYGIPSTRTAFVCTSTHPGTSVKASVIVPSAYPAGWDVCENTVMAYSMAPVLRDNANLSPDPLNLLESEMFMEEPGIITRPRRASVSKRMCSPPSTGAAPRSTVRISFSVLVNPDESEGRLIVNLPSWSKIRGIQLITDEDLAGLAEIQVMLYLGSRSVPVASVKLGDLLDGEIRPLNISCSGNDTVTIVLTDHEKIVQKKEIKFQLLGDENLSSDVVWM
ncbi:MAG TPA: VIT and VWA domain-containing protein [Methanospirillum sp.]|nr:VIT and VWA domain-containing protein [Methanospirillum sp.]